MVMGSEGDRGLPNVRNRHLNLCVLLNVLFCYSSLIAARFFFSVFVSDLFEFLPIFVCLIHSV